MRAAPRHEDTAPPLEWDDLTAQEREAVRALARDRVFWLNFYARLWWLKSAATVLLTFAAAVTLMRDGITDWLGITQGSSK